ncbi:MAG: hypothetical protein PVJ55_08850 [Anaerolineae bacterium]|jgi:hypothetical protein
MVNAYLAHRWHDERNDNIATAVGQETASIVILTRGLLLWACPRRLGRKTGGNAG